MQKYRLVGFFEVNKWMPLVVVAQVDPSLDGMVGFAIERAPLDHFDSAVNMKGKPVALIRHYTTTALAVFTWGQVYTAYQVARSVTFRDFGPQIKKENGINVISIEEWRNGTWVKLNPGEMPAISSASQRPKPRPSIGPANGGLALAAAALRERPRLPGEKK